MYKWRERRCAAGASGIVMNIIIKAAPLLLFAATFLVYGLVSLAHAAPQPRLLPLGDSITEGYPEQFPFSYRGTLQRLLGVGTYDFVGPFQKGAGAGDYDHAGVSGQETPAILARLRENLANELADAPPGSLVLIHAGTNDVLNGNTIDSAMANIAQMVEAIVRHDEAIGIYLATIIPIDGAADARAQELNAKIRTYVTQSALPQLHLVDQYAAFVAHDDWRSALMVDGVHPNTAGYDLMAQTWAAAIKGATAQQQAQSAAQTATAQTTAQSVEQKVSTVNAQQTATIQQQAQTAFPRDCAVAFDTQAVRNPLLVPARDVRVRCGDGIVFTTGSAQTYTYKTAYVTTDGEHFTQKIDLAGTRDATGEWIIGEARGTIPAAAARDTNYLAVYACTKVGNAFRCSCTTDGRCSRPAAGVFQWYVQAFSPTI